MISSGGTANPSLNRHHLHPEPALIPPRQDQDSIAHKLAVMEECDCIIQKKVFWVPSLARWKTLQDFAKLPPSTEIQTDRGFSARSYMITSTAKLIDFNFGKEPANSITSDPHSDRSPWRRRAAESHAGNVIRPSISLADNLALMIQGPATYNPLN